MSKCNASFLKKINKLKTPLLEGCDTKGENNSDTQDVAAQVITPVVT